MKCNREASWKSYIESPKKYGIKDFMKQKCLDMRLDSTITSEQVHRSRLDKILGIDREVIYFNITGDLDALNELRYDIERLVESTKNKK